MLDRNDILAILGVAALGAGCSGQDAAQACPSRFDSLVQVATVRGPVRANFVYDLTSLSPEAKTAAMKGVEAMTFGSSPSEVQQRKFKERSFSDQGQVMIAGATEWYGVGRQAASARDAVAAGCALERRYGTLRTVRLVTSSSDTKISE